MTNPIRKAREAAGLSQTDLTRRTGIAPQVISRLENGKRDLDGVRVGTMRKLAQALGTTIDALVTDKEQEE